jgi:2-polyprenyl-6-methoxyphenol hydroxylase-like FAD-dependent oxidoreductase
MESFSHLGVIDSFLKVGIKVHDIFVHHEGSRKVHIDYRWLAKQNAHPYPFILSLPQPQTEAILEDHLNRKGVRVERGVSIQHLENHSSHVDTVLCSSTDSGQSIENARFAYVVGCDGSRSSVRKAVGIPFEGDGYDHSFIHGDFQVSKHLNPSAVDYFMKDGRFCLIIPMVNNWFRVVIQVPARSPDKIHPELTNELFEKLTAEISGLKLGILRSRCLSNAKLYNLIAREVRVGNVFLAGDAFHQFSPVGGQGLNTGVGDAINLAWKLSYVYNGMASPALLDTYTEERLPLARQISRASDLSTSLLLQRDTRGGELSYAAVELQNNLLSSLANRHLHKHVLPFQFSGIAQSYSAPPVVSSAAPRSGQRVPEASFSAGSVFKCFRDWPRHWLFIYDDVKKSNQARETQIKEMTILHLRYGKWMKIAVIQGPRSNLLSLPDQFELFHDAASAFKRGFSVGNSGWILVRPDRYLQARGEEQASLRKYLQENYARGATEQANQKSVSI